MQLFSFDEIFTSDAVLPHVILDMIKKAFRVFGECWLFFMAAAIIFTMLKIVSFYL